MFYDSLTENQIALILTLNHLKGSDKGPALLNKYEAQIRKAIATYPGAIQPNILKYFGFEIGNGLGLEAEEKKEAKG